VLKGLQEKGLLSTAAPGRMSAADNDEWIKLVRACVPQADDAARPTN
jgi:hypothetical protein